MSIRLWNGPCIICLLLVYFWGTLHAEQLSELNAREIAILQYDSRPLGDYWLASALWNKQYCDKHNHLFIYYSGDECRYNSYTRLASPWCKVKAMRQANLDYPEIKLFIYMDSDAVVGKKFSGNPVNDMLEVMQHALNWDPEQKPVVFNQDGPCWWCQLTVKSGYKMCLNAGTVVWYRHKQSTKILDDWWHSAMDSYATNPIKRKFRIKWPWEQDRQMAVYNRTPHHIQIASDPNAGQMALHRGGKWCLSHLPGNDCFISHYCSHKSSKQILIKSFKVNGHPFKDDSKQRYGFGRVSRNESHPFGFKVDILR